MSLWFSLLSLLSAMQAPVEAPQTLNLILPLDLLATSAGAFGGALIAVHKRLDIIGILFLTFTSGLGGGLVRDVLLGRLPPVALTNTYYLLMVFIIAIVVAFLERPIRRIERAIFIVDALALGLFACVGAQLALAFNLPWPTALLVGTLNAVGGGIIRSMMIGETADVLLPGTVHATAVMIGCGLYIILVTGIHLDLNIAWAIAVCVIFILRVVGVWRKWQSPTAVDITLYFPWVTKRSLSNVHYVTKTKRKASFFSFTHKRGGIHNDETSEAPF